MVKNISFFSKFAEDLNKLKPNKKEIDMLNNIITNESKEDGFNNNLMLNNEISNIFIDKILALKTVPSLYNEIDYNILNIMKEISNKSSISIQKIINLYKKKFGVILSKTTVHRKLRNKLKFSYKKTTIKPKDLNKPVYIKMSFLFIKILLRAIELNLNIVFIDESHFRLKQPNFKTWIKKGDFSHIGSKKNGKINFLLAVSNNKLINYHFTELNTNTNVFKEFFLETISKLDEQTKSNTLFVMDNHVSHVSKKITNLVIRNKIKILYCVPYESCFNPIELSFRYIKNIIYKNIFFNISTIKHKVISILGSTKFQKSLFKNYLETLRIYFHFLNENLNFNMNTS